MKWDRYYKENVRALEAPPAANTAIGTNHRRNQATLIQIYLVTIKRIICINCKKEVHKYITFMTKELAAELIDAAGLTE